MAGEIVNLDQATAWDGPDGEYWVAHQARFDATIGPHHGALMAAAAIAPGERVLDIGCGNGQVDPRRRPGGRARRSRRSVSTCRGRCWPMPSAWPRTRGSATSASSRATPRCTASSPAPSTWP